MHVEWVCFSLLETKINVNGSVFPSNYITHITLLVNGNNVTSMGQHILLRKLDTKNPKVRLEPLRRRYENVYPSISHKSTSGKREPPILIKKYSIFISGQFNFLDGGRGSPESIVTKFQIFKNILNTQISQSFRYFTKFTSF